MDGVDPALVIGPSTEIIAGNGTILTAGAVDCHVHLICPQLLDEALAAGITTLIGGGTGPAEGTKATTVTPGAWHLARMLAGARRAGRSTSPCSARATRCRDEALREQLRGGRRRASSCTRTGARRRRPSTPACASPTQPGVQVAIHTDTLNEAGYVRVDAGRHRRAVDPHVPHRGRRRRPRPRHHHRVLASPTCCRRRPTRPGRTPSTRRRAPRHADGLPPPQPGGARGPGVRREPHPPVDDRRRGRPPRPGRDLDDRLGLPGDGPHRRGRASAPGRPPT